jgi:hypothetical protein
VISVSAVSRVLQQSRDTTKLQLSILLNVVYKERCYAITSIPYMKTAGARAGGCAKGDRRRIGRTAPEKINFIRRSHSKAL